MTVITVLLAGVLAQTSNLFANAIPQQVPIGIDESDGDGETDDDNVTAEGQNGDGDGEFDDDNVEASDGDGETDDDNVEESDGDGETDDD
ncbi:hypothetical protein [Candidatus Nitrosotenuis cloacae]|uniref:Uncharacterized protein n=1 Tax=Candidatus Nitrosotenuis cloacae TaxID=1603555 RepID=A0A3G1B2L3_9ARCH|nr:hypothetical protein [Candidatus Nitrosotenuis cloacae]AJZ75886.1 hypothetical protein SU86_005345 [Candidatus Nitrosotenuis cloacae]